MRFTVAIPPEHRSSVELRLGRDVLLALEWGEPGEAEVTVGYPGGGRMGHCAAWPGAEAAAALVESGFARLKDRRTMERLNEVGRALASEQVLERLLDLILDHGRKLLQAEAGSIYLVVGPPEQRELLFAHTQNARVSLPYHHFRLPISTASMAGFVAATGECLNIPDAYQLPPDAPYYFNKSFDLQASYRTVSMLSVPMRDTEGGILGVLQFINRIEQSESSDTCIAPFRAEHEGLAHSLAGQAAVAVKNAQLREDIERLLEGFVNASVLAIEQRDPVTSGHSGRVADLTVGIAEAVNRLGEGPYGPTFFSDRQLRELRYASLLHDFGKVGVREMVLVKSKKLDPHRLELILQRLHQRREEHLLGVLQRDWEAGRPFDPERWRVLLAQQQAETDRQIALVLRTNEPAVLPEDVAAEVDRLGDLRFTHWDGATKVVLEEADLDCLRIRKGSLSEAERLEIESHVTHTFRFLRQIPWTRDLEGVPDIAYAHHERINGLGYPRRLSLEDIPVQSRAMAIGDVFDALTAQDRPYKAALPVDRSLAILESDARAGHLDPELLRIFIDAKVYLRTVKGA